MSIKYTGEIPTGSLPAGS